LQVYSKSFSVHRKEEFMFYFFVTRQQLPDLLGAIAACGMNRDASKSVIKEAYRQADLDQEFEVETLSIHLDHGITIDWLVCSEADRSSEVSLLNEGDSLELTGFWLWEPEDSAVQPVELEMFPTVRNKRQVYMINEYYLGCRLGRQYAAVTWSEDISRLSSKCRVIQNHGSG
jgi:hypothetical protein